MPLFLWSSTEGLVLPPDQLKGQLEFRDVSFAYPTRKEAPIFHNLSLLVPAGTIMAVVGPSGSGKSTLVSLLLRLYDPDAGESDHTLSKDLMMANLKAQELMPDGWFLTSDNHAFSPGFISIDGHDIRDLNPYWLRSHIGTVSQVINSSFTHNKNNKSLRVKIVFLTFSLSSPHLFPRSPCCFLAL